MSKTSESAAKTDKGLLGFISELFSGVLGGSDSDREKKRLLKEIGKELRKRSRFFSLKGAMAQPAMAKWLYEIYRIVGPAAIILEKYGSSDLLKTILIEHFLPGDVRKAVGELQPDRLKERVSAAGNISVVAEQVKEELLGLYAALDSRTVKRVNKLYNDLCALQDFARYPYHFLLKKFDSRLPEADFSYVPRFEAISAKYIKDDLAEFLDVFYAIDGEAEWDVLFDLLKNYRDTDLLSRPAWKKILGGQRDMMKTRTLDLIVRYLEENPRWSARPEPTRHEIVEGYFKRIKTGADLAVKEVLRGRKQQQMDQLLNQLFGTTSISRTQYYTERDNLTYHKKMLGGYIYIEPVNYLKAFFLDYYKGSVRVLVDLLLIQGKWSTKLSSQQLSESYHQLLSLSDQLTAFDSSLADDGSRGTRIKRLLMQSARERSAINSLKNVLADVNGEARSVINASAQNLIVLGKSLKQLMDEYRNQGQDIIINWKELESRAEPSLETQFSEVYSRIYYLVQLLQLCMKDRKQGTPPA